MICSICKRGETSVVDSRPTEMVQLLEEEDFVHAEKGSQHLKECNLES